MQKRTLGKTNLEVTPIGFGTAQIGFVGMEQSDCDHLLNGVLDAGVNVIDTAACYVDAEEKVGKSIGSRRDEYVLVSKCGHKIADDDPPEWSPELIRSSAERSLRLLKADCLDVLLIHSCSKEALENEAMIEALLKCKSDGLARFVGYSGDRGDLDYALTLDSIDCIETSISICDQQVLDNSLPKAKELTLGVFAKRPIANSVWRDMTKYGGLYGGYTAAYTERLKKMDFTPESVGFDGSWIELALRFTLFQPGMHTALVGGMNLDHVKDNLKIADQGPLPDSVQQKLTEVWAAHDDGSWVGQT
ncbi:MAG: aldo/keto reductase [Candidatus Omnitrophica bacterium]|nr:aldo/keto reductase [Candidatus Omnitrophota bacterium]